MSDETATAVADEAPAAYKMSLAVEIESTGPCRRHVRVKVPQTDIEHFRTKAVEEVAENTAVPGFRAGRVPRGLIEKKFKKELSDQVRQQVLLTSLEQLAADHSLDPINEPNFDVESLILPDLGDFEYEFDVEVRPDFELPNYTGLSINRPTREISEADIDAYLKKFTAQYGELKPKESPAALGDRVEVDLEFHWNGELLRRMNGLNLEVRGKLRFPDGELGDFGALLTGAVKGDVRETQLVISPEAESVEKRGETVQVRITVHSVNDLVVPELNKEFLARLDLETEEELRTQVRNMLNRQLQYEQRQSARQQVLEKITESATWDLPEELVRKQVENAMRRELLEMQQAGFTTQEIRTREAALRQKSISTTRQALKEHFVLDKIATKEQIECTPPDIDSEIYMMALQSGENPRRVRARMQKSGIIDNLEAQIRERKAIEFIIKQAVYNDVPTPAPVPEDAESVSLAICGQTAVVDEGDEADADE